MNSINNEFNTSKADLTILFDGGCPLCLREVNFLKGKDNFSRLNFINIDSSDYDPMNFMNISYEKAMERIHAITSDGKIVKDVEVFRIAYDLVGIGWIYKPTILPLIKPIVDYVYDIWAKYRLRITGRPSLSTLSSCKKANCQKLQ